MRYLAIFSFLSLLFTVNIPVFADDNADLAKRISIAKDYSKISPIKDNINQAIDNLVVQLPKENRTLFRSILNRTMDSDRLESASNMALVDLFTTDELEAMIAFYSSPEGKEIQKKLPQYSKRMEPLINQMMEEAFASYEAQVK